MNKVRCAIYTRKSSEEGLEQDFNSLDAQREACAAYVLSQASEGWTALPDRYDDGGISGGSLERPALKRLLEDIASGKVDIIVVYKVDRLTRSLLDFSKLVEAFDAAGVSFVSVTQSFNTTTSMGRLTLNMLLSFAQFEREVTAERIRDKIAQSKARGMWMGGIPPVGYKPDGRSLAIIPDHAALVREIFALYLEVRNVRLVEAELRRRRLLSPVRETATGKSFGGGPFSRGQLYLILKCPTYVGEVHHRGQVYDGLHDAIVEREVWDRVQEALASNVRGLRTRRAATESVLAGRIVDAEGTPLVASHSCKGARRYRYYLGREAEDQHSAQLRLPAIEVESAIAHRIADAFNDLPELCANAWLTVPLAALATAGHRATECAAKLRRRDRALLQAIIQQVLVDDGHIEILCDVAVIADLLRAQQDEGGEPTLRLVSHAHLKRSGGAVRLVHSSGAVVGREPDQALVRLLAKARRWWLVLRQGELDVFALAAREGVTGSYLTRVVRLAFLSPSVVEAIFAGRARAGVDGALLTTTGAVPASWAEQAHLLLPAVAVE